MTSYHGGESQTQMGTGTLAVWDRLKFGIGNPEGPNKTEFLTANARELVRIYLRGKTHSSGGFMTKKISSESLGAVRWLNRTVLGIGLASLCSDWSHEMAT